MRGSVIQGAEADPAALGLAETFGKPLTASDCALASTLRGVYDLRAPQLEEARSMTTMLGETLSSVASVETLTALQEIAQRDGRDLEAVVDEALRAYVQRRMEQPRRQVLGALAESVREFDDLYRALAK